MTDNYDLWKELHDIARATDNDEGRVLEDLLKTDEMLVGIESQRLRSYCVSVHLEPARDLDDFGTLLLQKPLSDIEQDFDSRIESYLKPSDPTPGNDEDMSRRAVKWVCDDLYRLRWGPTQVPIYSLLEDFRSLKPDQRSRFLDIALFYIEKGVPVDGKDVSATTALTHSFSIKPTFDLEYAQVLFDAGGDVNERNRYGSTAAHEIVQLLTDDPQSKENATESFQWFLSHGGNVDVADSDGMVVRDLCESICVFMPGFMKAIDKEDERRAALKGSCCTFLLPSRPKTMPKVGLATSQEEL
ncbi:hypothetical protein AGABI1DRAFT_121629 [Agaricus bisporus var. burnettii JB137-S8]|uniref:Uncharacterized protein n=1 Tax=Agaricus bisporus var. burnettii (strain JB137-S8 / ATCC MYA-4627 / FGSC 10392) TaxID=597362 RepID=K5X4R8_AGABU|nr:uncharacterized protein AGABI1DRAFT_121629 [Agaricus bisporus var. burnettii JB137-S8]EKM77942.1 hypothetical protein AGABI1DRAFT_121629 [Agaricus bisporus var. burnettii JB137-S8]